MTDLATPLLEVDNNLALGRGQTFIYPTTFADADREIKRLRRVKSSSRSDRRREVRAVSADMRARGDGASIRSHELGGYGSSAHWQ